MCRAPSARTQHRFFGFVERGGGGLVEAAAVFEVLAQAEQKVLGGHLSVDVGGQCMCRSTDLVVLLIGRLCLNGNGHALELVHKGLQPLLACLAVARLRQ